MIEPDFERLSRLVIDEFQRVQDRFDSVDIHFADLRDEVRSIRKQLDALETTSENFVGFAKEIDHLLGRVTAIEKHLGLSTSITA